MAKYKAEIKFDMDYSSLEDRDVKELCEYIVEAVETWGGQRHPDDWLFYGIKNVQVVHLKELYSQGRKLK